MLLHHYTSCDANQISTTTYPITWNILNTIKRKKKNKSGESTKKIFNVGEHIYHYQN